MVFRARTITALAGMAIAALALSGSNGARPGGAQAEGADITAWGTSGSIHEQLWKDSFASWNDEHPDGQVDAEFFANDALKERIRTAIGAGTEPTLIFNWAGGTLQEYIDNGSVAPLTDGTENVLDRVLPSVAQPGTIDGEVYAIPNSQSQPVLLYFNTELFEQVGLEAPTTWDELLASVEVFNDNGIAPFSVAGQSRWPYLMWIQYLTDRIGGPEVFQAVLDGEEDAWSDPAIISALEHIQELVDAGGFADGFGSVSADANADIALVYTGRAAMVLQGSWVYSTFKGDAAEFVESGGLGVAAFPTVEGGTGDAANIVGNPSNYWAVSSNASEEQIATATAYLDEAVWNDDYTTTLIEGGGVPPIADIEDELAEQEDADFLTLAYGLVRDAPHFQLSWDQALAPDQAQDLLTNLEQVFLLQSTPQQFADAMNATIG